MLFTILVIKEIAQNSLKCYGFIKCNTDRKVHEDIQPIRPFSSKIKN